MAYDEGLAQRVREVLAGEAGISEKTMFGGLAFLVHGHMAVGVNADSLMVRVGPDAHAEALALPGARPMDFTGRPLKGYVFVDPAGYAEDRDLAAWVERSLAFVRSLPPK